MIQHPFTTPKPTMNKQLWPKAKEKQSIWLSSTPFARHLSSLSIFPYPPLIKRINLGYLQVLDVLITIFNITLMIATTICWMIHLHHGLFFHHTHHVNDRTITNIGPNVVERTRKNMKISILVGDFNFELSRISFVVSLAFYYLVVVVVIVGIDDTHSLSV